MKAFVRTTEVLVMKIGRNLSNSLLRSEIFNRANKSFGTSMGLSFWRRSRLLIGFVLCSVGLLLALAGLSQVCHRNSSRRGASANIWKVDGNWQPQQRTLSSHCDVAAQRQGACGGRDNNEGDSLASAELYDPANGSWTAYRQPRHRTR